MLKIENSKYNVRTTIICLILIVIGSILIKFHYFTYEIPITYDGLLYLLYAKTTAELGHLPVSYSLDNNGWAIFLSIFFSLFSFNSALEYMNLQRFISMFISTLTVIPIYFLIRKFFDSKYALVGAMFFAVEPRLIQNSLLGITESLYLILITITLTLFFSNNKKIIYFSIVISALSTLVRSEGLFLFIALSVMFVIRFRKDKWVIPKYLPALAIFMMVLLPMTIYQTNVLGEDRVVTRVINGVDRISDSYVDFALRGIENYVKFLVWDLIPVFIIFVPIGFLLLLRNLNFHSSTILMYSIIMSLPALFAYSVPALDTRYLFFLYPGFCIMTIYTINKIVDKNKFKNYIIIIIIISIIISSFTYLEYKKADHIHEKEAMEIAEYLVKNTKGINDYYPNSKYIKSLEVMDKWPDVYINPLPFEIKMISEKGHNSLDEFLIDSKSKGITHLVIDENENRPFFLQEVYNNEEKFPSMIKEFDSEEIEMNYHVKVFKIDYKKLN